jgi:hypothetical protein
MPNRVFAVMIVAAAALVTAQCSGGDNLTGASRSLSLATSPGGEGGRISARAVGDVTSAVAEPGKVKLCKVGDVSGTFTVSMVGDATVLPNPTLAPGACVVVAESSVPTGATVTITETPATYLQGATVKDQNGTVTAFANGGNVFLNYIHGYVVTFTNDQPEPPPPPPGVEGCTPGFWKQPQHLDSWTTYLPSADFDATFGVDFFTPNMTLLEAAGANGGGTSALARHAVAALLNAASAGVDSPYTVAQVLDIVQGDGAYAGLTVEQRKNLLAAANELGCPLS